MSISDANTVEEYLDELPDERRKVIGKIRDLILQNLPDGYKETMNWGMISYEIPLDRYPDTYNGKPLGYVALAAQKNYNALYLMSIYSDPEKDKFLRDQFKKAGKKIDIGKSCIRFKKIDDLPLEAIGKIISGITPDEFIELHEKSRKRSG